MSRILYPLSALPLALVILAALPQPGRSQNLDYLSLSDSTLAVVANMPVEDLKTQLDAISDLLNTYDRSKRDADDAKHMIQDSISAQKKELDILKTKIELAKKEGRAGDQDSLEAYKKALETKRDYFEKAEDVREAERRYAQSLVEWTKSHRAYLEKAVQLMEERQREGRDRDLLTLEQELIKAQEAAADRLQKTGDEMNRVADKRMDMYKVRDKLLNPNK